MQDLLNITEQCRYLAHHYMHALKECEKVPDYWKAVGICLASMEQLKGPHELEDSIKQCISDIKGLQQPSPTSQRSKPNGKGKDKEASL